MTDNETATDDRGSAGSADLSQVTPDGRFQAMAAIFPRRAKNKPDQTLAVKRRRDIFRMLRSGAHPKRTCPTNQTWKATAIRGRAPFPQAIRRIAVPAMLAAMLSSCSGNQSALDPAGVEAGAVYDLFIAMAVGGTLIWALTIGLLAYAGRKRPQPLSVRGANRLILWGGVAFPVAVLFLLLSYAVWLMPQVRPWLPGARDGSVQIEVTGEQFWWRILYLDATGRPEFETANEVRLPVGRRTTFRLKAADVIHSFWIPALGGKMDMIPGRDNILSLEPTKTGIFRGPCAEFCGTSHALMAFSVVVMEETDYAAWRDARAAPRQASITTAATATGRDLFFRHGCAACHAVSGTPAIGRIGPDLTALGERQTLAAGTLSNSPASMIRFIRNPASIKPGVKMPAFGMLPEGDIAAIAAWLGGLR